MTAAIILTLVCVAAATLIHYEALRWVTDMTPRLAIPPRRRMLAVLAFAFVAHLAEIALFAAGFAGMEALGVGSLGGVTEGGAMDYFYFSASSYTTLGTGDIFPTGALRFVAGVEALAGLVLIGWTASYTYLSMREFWDLH